MHPMAVGLGIISFNLYDLKDVWQKIISPVQQEKSCKIGQKS